MITIVSATNRPKNNTLKIASIYAQLLEKQGVVSKISSLEFLSVEIVLSDIPTIILKNFKSY